MHFYNPKSPPSHSFERAHCPVGALRLSQVVPPLGSVVPRLGVQCWQAVSRLHGPHGHDGGLMRPGLWRHRSYWSPQSWDLVWLVGVPLEDSPLVVLLEVDGLLCAVSHHSPQPLRLLPVLLEQALGHPLLTIVHFELSCELQRLPFVQFLDLVAVLTSSVCQQKQSLGTFGFGLCPKCAPYQHGTRKLQSELLVHYPNLI